MPAAGTDPSRSAHPYREHGSPVVRALFFAGARILHHWPLSIVGHGLGLNVTVESYAGLLEFGVTTALAAVPRPRSFADALLAAFGQLKARSRAR